MNVLRGTSTILANLRVAIEKMQNAADQAVEDVANDIAFQSANQAPFDIGTLKSTLRVTKTGKAVRVISYNTPYAVRLHENPQYNFKNGRKGKYLEDPLKENVGKAKVKMAGKISAVIGGKIVPL